MRAFQYSGISTHPFSPKIFAVFLVIIIGGLGFIKLELRGDDIYENNKLIDKARFEEIKDSMRNYIVTQYAQQHDDLKKVWPNSECTLRVIMCKNVSADKYSPSKWSCAVSYARFGTSVNGGASNLSSGGVGVGFDFETGKDNAFHSAPVSGCLSKSHFPSGVNLL